jgi:pimeloyl-ACP methyl ester carboxylesterase
VDDVTDPQFRWLEQGAGEPMLFLHGLMGQMHHWGAVLEGLAPLGRPIALALPILDPALRDVSIEGVMQHVCAFLDALDIPRAIVGGNSLGGHVALALAVAHPDRVAGLILTGSSGLLKSRASYGMPRQPSREYVREKMEETVFDRLLITDAWVESMRAILTSRTSAVRVLRFAREARRTNMADGLRRIDVPTLLVWGREDRITPPAVAEQFRSLIPAAQLTYLDRCGHNAMLERPLAFIDLVAHWLGATRDQRVERDVAVTSQRLTREVAIRRSSHA